MLDWTYYVTSFGNHVARRLLGVAARVSAPVLVVVLRFRRCRWKQKQMRLRSALGVDDVTPVELWSLDLQEKIDRRFAGRADIRFAQTTGTTGKPKRIPYDRRRLKAIRQASAEAVVLTSYLLGLRNPCLFVLSGASVDSSLSSLLMELNAEPSLLEGLLMPSRYLNHEGFSDLRSRYGLNALRVLLLVLANPSIIYATNPSTILVFLTAIETEWPSMRALLGEIAGGPLTGSLRRAIRRAAVPGWRGRLATVLSDDVPPRLSMLAPALRCYCCWDGGYVMPFLAAIARQLAPLGILHVPMYSMATEGIQTQMVVEGGRMLFQPLTSGVLYEFLPEDAAPDPSRLIPPDRLEPGRSYAMVMSNGYGLKRYVNGDVFLCRHISGGLPDLRFKRRAGMTYSFTGEKLDGRDAEAAIEELTRSHLALTRNGLQLTLIPSLGAAPGELPHYRLVVAYTASSPPDFDLACIASDFDRHVAIVNSEFSEKQKSGRLGSTRGVAMSYDHLAACLALAGSPAARSWETQFKLTPLMPHLWCDLGLTEPEEAQ